MDKVQFEGHNDKFKILFKVFTRTMVEMTWYVHNLDQLPIHTTRVTGQLKPKE